MKQPPTQGNSKPNAWSKPLQGSQTNRKSTNPSIAASSAGAAQPKTSHVASSNSSKAPPGLSKPHHSDKNSSTSNANLNALRERYLHLLLTLVGHKVTVVLKSNVKYTGILHTATPFSHLPEPHRHKYVLKAVTADGTDDNDDTATKIKPGQTVLLDMDSVVQLHVKSCRLDALVGSGKGSMSDAFTDTEISGAIATKHGNRPSRGGSNDLIQADATWTSAADPTTPTLNSRALKLAGGSLTSTSTPSASTSGALKGSIAGWDQFKANEELFNVVGSYDESVYTTTLDRSQFSASDRQRAEQLAREIESTASSNLHIAEERGHVLSQDYDEEDRYSGVLKPNMKPKLNYAQVVTSKATDPVPPGFDGESDIAAAQAKPEADPAAAAATAAIETESTTPAVTEPVETVEDKKQEELEPTIEQPTEEAVVAEEDVAAVADASSAETVEAAVKADGDAAAAAAAEKPTPPETKFKLSATAKSFSFNINAKTFTPTPPAPPPPPPPPQPVPLPQFMDHSAGIPMMMTMGAPMIPEGKMLSFAHVFH
jgi:small nuclear ribonucleoprotein (snRNP)-like protein